MLPNWRKLENENGFAFYVNEITNEKQWDHPKFVEIRRMIDDCNYVKYSKYRVALKFRILQRALFVEHILLNTILGVFNKHRLGVNESSLCLESYDLEAVLSDIYFAANKLNRTEIDVDFAVELMQNFLYNVYDKERQGKTQVSSTKLVLALLCDCDTTELHNLIFKLCADHNNCVTRLRLQSVLNKLVEIFTFLHEDVSFGHHLINSTIESCFNRSPGLAGICESNFITWLDEAPHLLCWIPNLFKLRLSERVVHPSKCSTCKTNPIIGLMYRCIKCSKYTQCQHCFLTGRTSNSHKLSHTMREYCKGNSNREFTFNFIRKICGLMPCSVKFSETTTMIETKPSSSEKEFLLNSSHSEEVFVEVPSTPHAQIQHIIKQLELQNRDLQKILLLGDHNEKQIRKYLENHRDQVSTHIHKLKILKEHFDNVTPKTTPKNIIESTPMVGLNKPSKARSLDMLSPILQNSLEGSTEQNTKDYPSESLPYSMNDISTWIRDQPTCSKSDVTTVGNSPVRELHNDLDDALAKLQQILANNFSLDESLGSIDNNHLKLAVSEVEGMLTSFIDTVENSRASSVQREYGTDFLSTQ